MSKKKVPAPPEGLVKGFGKEWEAGYHKGAEEGYQAGFKAGQKDKAKATVKVVPPYPNR